MVFEGLSMNQIRQFFLEGEGPTLTFCMKNAGRQSFLEFLDFGSKSWTLDSERWILDAERKFKIQNWPKIWKQWGYINNFILEFDIDKDLWSFQV